MQLKFRVFIIAYTVDHTEDSSCIHDEHLFNPLLSVFSLSTSLAVLKANHRNEPVALPLCVP